MAIVSNCVIGRKKVFANGSGIHKGGSLTPSNPEIQKMTNQINNASTSIPGLGTGPRINITAKSEYRPAGNSISYGGGLPYGLNELNFSSKKKEKNVKLRV